ncbi:RusA family crossover junction endodeoxyribonuclease [Paenibacillus sp. RC84]|uniref:RusA family crossover junction endodeoxyribonuclease n=1 Tax=Paenibacillus sp. RC84 TaxID=3156252 RepID=UPI003513A798
MNEKSLQFTVFGEPVAQGRPKFSTVGGFVKAYDPKKSRDFKDYVKLAASEHRPTSLLEHPLILEVNVYRSMPKSFSKKKALAAEDGLVLPITKPDIDNYVKGIKDALKGIIWKDDSQVADLIARKRYSSTPRIEITIKPL